MPFWLGPASRFGPLLFTTFINGSHLLRMRNLPGLRCEVKFSPLAGRQERERGKPDSPPSV